MGDTRRAEEKGVREDKDKEKERGKSPRRIHQYENDVFPETNTVNTRRQ